MTSSNILLFPGRAFRHSMTPANFMVIGLQIGKLHSGGGGGRNPSLAALPDSEKPDLFRVKILSSTHAIGISQVTMSNLFLQRSDTYQYGIRSIQYFGILNQLKKIGYLLIL